MLNVGTINKYNKAEIPITVHLPQKKEIKSVLDEMISLETNHIRHGDDGQQDADDAVEGGADTGIGHDAERDTIEETEKCVRRRWDVLQLLMRVLHSVPYHVCPRQRDQEHQQHCRHCEPQPRHPVPAKQQLKLQCQQQEQPKNMNMNIKK